MKYSYLLILVMLNSCIQNTKEESLKIKGTKATTEIKQEIAYRDTITIDYRNHEALLTVLKLLPETTMDSWDWSKEDRIKTVAFIEKYNYLIDSIEMYHNIKYIKANTIGIQVVDGVWTLSIYEFNKNNYFIVTNDIVGDENDIQTFNFIDNEIIPLKMINWFDGAGYRLLKNNSKECTQLIEDNLLRFGYDFTAENEIEISSLLTKSESQGCFEGNTIKYRLNKQKRTFDIVDVYWKNHIVVDSLKKAENSKATLSTQELMLLTKVRALKKYGIPSFSEQYVLDDVQGEFRNSISDKFTLKERQNESILIDELTWEKDKNTWVTAWYQSIQEHSIPKSVYVWRKETEF